MPRYRVLKRSFINSSLREEGDEIEFEGEAGNNLLLLDPLKTEGRPAKAGASDK